MGNVKLHQRGFFWLGFVFGFAPLLAHLLIAGAEAAGMFQVQSGLPFAKQNWLGHIVFAGIAISSSSIVNYLKSSAKQTFAARMVFGHLIIIFVLMWLAFGLFALGGPIGAAVWGVVSVIVVIAILLSYIVDMQIALEEAQGREAVNG